MVTTDANADSSFFEAQVSGIAPLEVHLYHLSLAGNLTPTSATPGQAVAFMVNISNPAERSVMLDNAQTTISFDDGTNFFSAGLDGSPVLLPGINAVSFVSTVINANFTPTGYTPVISIQGVSPDHLVSGNIVLPTNSLSLITTNIAALSLQPNTVTSGTQVVFTVQLQNSGSGNVTLDQSNSYIMFNGEQVFLNQSYAVPGGGTPVDVEFETNSISSAPAGTPFPVTIHLEGTNNGVPITPLDLAGPSNILVQGAPNVIANSIQMLTFPVVQNQDIVIARVQLFNDGSNLADARIDLANDIELGTSQLSGLRSTSASIVDLSAGSTINVDFQFSIAESYPAGNEFLTVDYQYTDVNSQLVTDPAPITNSNAFIVLRRAELQFVSSSFGGSAPPGGNTTFEFTVQNIGEVNLQITNVNDIDLNFNNNHVESLNSPSPGTFPVTIAPSITQIFTYNIAVDPGSANGPDPVDLLVTHTDLESGKQYQDIDITKVDTLSIDTGAGSNDVQILVVEVPAGVNQGQTDIPATVQIKNFSGSSIDILDVTISSNPTGITGIRDFNVPALLNPNETGVYPFNLSVDGVMPPGSVTINAGYSARDRTTLIEFTDNGNGASSPGVTTVFEPAALSVGAVTVTPSTANTGQKPGLLPARSSPMAQGQLLPQILIHCRPV